MNFIHSPNSKQWERSAKEFQEIFFFLVWISILIHEKNSTNFIVPDRQILNMPKYPLDNLERFQVPVSKFS